MPVLLVALALGVLAYFVWRSRTSNLTRNCRWRLHRSAGVWRCAFCGAEQPGEAEPRRCLRGRDQ
ncbi:hypothetical protein FGK63_03845 [Ruegeria sediminis]|uniref:Uncharacterized protein n=1 Tax=Ruegeria sediminis TaxID=2583820 RepID=A0ABY2X487_9RHOB|nr:hypothetical protein [Ruegeria sediminis]TMV10204.1 hypothetical protein FGK63_03845 [Ruegeria sediminis]